MNKPLNWIHLDCKGVMPATPQRFCQWIDWLADRGFNGIVLEYEDRLPWQTWPGTFRPGLELDPWQQVLAHIKRRNLTLVPLIQTHGHLEWLLKHDTWARWRENGRYNELCPQHPDIYPTLEKWIDELFAIHGQLDYVHIGADETWNLATCPSCRDKAAASSQGKLSIYLSHLNRVADMIIRRGARPIIWADMFWRENRLDLIECVPSQVILCDWRYTGAGPWQTVEQLAQAGHTVVGGSGLRCGGHWFTQAQAPLGDRLTNVLGWREHPGVAGWIHTFWGRPRSLMPSYGPWEGWLPAMIAAGDPTQWQQHPLRPWVQRLDEVLATPGYDPARTLTAELKQVRFEDPFSEQCRQWWVLALRWYDLTHGQWHDTQRAASLKSVVQHLGMDPHLMAEFSGRINDREANALPHWQRDVRAYFQATEQTDAQEYTQARADMFLAMHSR